MHYYRHDLALIHDRGHGQHADRCAPGIVELLSPVRDGVVLELGCGSGALTRHLLTAGFQVIATDASPDMLALARASLGPGADLRRLTLPEDPLPAADAVVSVGHVISYLSSAAAVDQVLVAMAGALRPGGVPSIPGRGETRSSGISPRSFRMDLEHGGATTSGTRTCSWTPPAYRRCSGNTAWMPWRGRRLARRSLRREWSR
jgi:SAM-dependent methyltransferase